MTTEGRANTKDDHSTTTQKVVGCTVAIVGVALIVLGLVHTIIGLPLVFKAVESGGINLPSIEDSGVQFRLLREPVVYGLLSVGVDRCIFGVLMLLCIPALKEGSRLAWRICMAIGLLFVLGYTPLICVVFESAHVPALVMPALGMVLVGVLWFGRSTFKLG